MYTNARRATFRQDQLTAQTLDKEQLPVFVEKTSEIIAQQRPNISNNNKKRKWVYSMWFMNWIVQAAIVFRIGKNGVLHPIFLSCLSQTAVLTGEKPEECNRCNQL